MKTIKKLRVSGFTLVSVGMIVLMLSLMALGRQRATPGASLDLSANGTDVVPALRNAKHQLLMYNFRAVEPNVLYRSSGFPANVKVEENGKSKKRPAAFADGQLFDFLRKRGIRTVVSTQEFRYFYAEQGYFQWWEKRTGYKVEVVSLSVKDGHGYNLGSSGGLAAASKFLELMKKRKPEDGAVLVHCDSGKDRTGVAVAAYELWRNAGKEDPDKLWKQVVRRYLASNAEIGKDKEAGLWSGGEVACSQSSSNARGYVCDNWIEPLRKPLELIAQL